MFAVGDPGSTEFAASRVAVTYRAPVDGGIWFDIGSGATGSIRVSAVFKDGTYSDNIQCVSAEAL